MTKLKLGLNEPCDHDRCEKRVPHLLSFEILKTDQQVNNSDCRKPLVAVNSGLIPNRVKPMTSRLVFTAFLLDAQHQSDTEKSASLLS